LEKFAFIIHPIDVRRDVARHKKYRLAQYLPEPWVEHFIKRKDPLVASHITGVRSITGAEAEGWFIVCPLSPRQFLTLDTEFVYHRLVQCGKIAEELGAGIIGLGAFTSVVGDGGVSVAKELKIAVTTGNSYTVATAIEAALDGARRMGIDIPAASAAVVGASGSIGLTCAEILGKEVARLALAGRDQSRLEEAHAGLPAEVVAKATVYTEIPKALKDADIVVTVTSAVDVVIQPEDLKTGAVVCDVARPRDVSTRVAKERDDVLVIEGGVVSVPGDVDFRFNFGFPPKMAYACMSETMMLALEGRYESFTLGKTVSVHQVEETQRLAKKHGFHLAGYRSFEKAVTDQQIDEIKANAARRASQVAMLPKTKPARLRRPASEKAS
jgi:predicted amino acid dehydrogenase